MAAGKGALQDDIMIMLRLDEIAAMVPFRPLEEPFCAVLGSSLDRPAGGPRARTWK